MEGPAGITSSLMDQATQVAQVQRQSRAIEEFKLQAAKAEDPAAKAGAQKMAALENVARDFESMFLHMMMKQMREAGPKSDFLGKSRAEEIFTDMRDQEMAKGLAEAGGIGLATLLVAQLKSQL